jgi:hypothetical protein
MNQPTDNEIIQVLAEAEGWKISDSGFPNRPFQVTRPDGGLYYCADKYSAEANFPDYLNDLNAIARVWKILKPFQRTENAMNIRRVVKEEMDTPENQDPDTGRLDDMHFYGATPRQHAIALARTLKPELFK